MRLKQNQEKAQTTVRIRLCVTAARASSVQRPASTGEKSHNTTFPGRGPKVDTQVWPSRCSWWNCSEIGMAGWDWLGSGSLHGEHRAQRGFWTGCDWPVNLHSLNLATHCENCRRAPQKTAKRDHLQGRFLNSLNNTEKGLCKDNVVFETQQGLSTGFQDFVCKLMLNPTGRRMPLTCYKVFPSTPCSLLKKVVENWPTEKLHTVDMQ